MDLYALPRLPALKNLHLDFLNGQIPFGDQQVSFLQTDGLEGFYVTCNDSNGLDEKGMAQYLDWLLPSSSQTLREISVAYTKLDTLPLQLSSFRNLKSVGVSDNQADLTLRHGTFFFKSDDADDDGIDILIRSSRLVKVEPGAFQGIYHKILFSIISIFLI